MNDYEILWAQTLDTLPSEAVGEVEAWSALDQISVIAEARGRALHRNAEKGNGLLLPEAVRQVVLERLG